MKDISPRLKENRLVSRLQEVSAETSKAPGRIPQTIECELTNDLVNSAIPGDVVVVSGVVKLTVDDGGKQEEED